MASVAVRLMLSVLILKLEPDAAHVPLRIDYGLERLKVQSVLKKERHKKHRDALVCTM